MELLPEEPALDISEIIPQGNFTIPSINNFNNAII
jgi:hypothetical protein